MPILRNFLAVTCAVALLLAGCGDSQIQSSDNLVVNDALVAESEHCLLYTSDAADES